jgi:hypothetical protein
VGTLEQLGLSLCAMPIRMGVGALAGERMSRTSDRIDFSPNLSELSIETTPETILTAVHLDQINVSQTD